MADLLFGGFALMPGPVRKEKQFRIPDDFSKTHFTFLSRTCAVPRPVFPRFFYLCPEIAKLYTSTKQRNFSIFLRGRNRPSLTAVTVKGNISGGIKGLFLA